MTFLELYKHQSKCQKDYNHSNTNVKYAICDIFTVYLKVSVPNPIYFEKR